MMTVQEYRRLNEYVYATALASNSRSSNLRRHLYDTEPIAQNCAFSPLKSMFGGFERKRETNFSENKIGDETCRSLALIRYHL